MSSKFSSKAPEPEKRVGKITVSVSGKVDAGEIKTALLTPTSDQQDGKNGSHAPSETTIAVEDTEVEKTSEGGIKTRKLSQIKKRVSQEFNENTTAKKWLIWTGHLVGASVPYIAILMGAIYRDECPANRNIPLHLIVSGVVTALLHLSTSIDMHRKLSYLRDKESKKPAIFSLLSLFLFIWMILGCVWTFGIYQPEYDYGQFWPYSSGYCHKALYWFAFVFNLVSLVSFLLGWLLCCCVCSILCHTSILTCLCADKDKDEDEAEEAATPVQV